MDNFPYENISSHIRSELLTDVEMRLAFRERLAIRGEIDELLYEFRKTDGNSKNEEDIVAHYAAIFRLSPLYPRLNRLFKRLREIEQNLLDTIQFEVLL